MLTENGLIPMRQQDIRHLAHRDATMKYQIGILAFLLILCAAAPAGDAEVDLLNARIDRLEAQLKQVTQLALHLQGLVQQSKKNVGLVGLESVDGNSTEDGGGIIDDLALNDLSDVVIVNPQKYQVLTYDGSVWTNDWVRWE